MKRLTLNLTRYVPYHLKTYKEYILILNFNVKIEGLLIPPAFVEQLNHFIKW